MAPITFLSFCILAFPRFLHALPNKAYRINCGSTNSQAIDGLEWWQPDNGFTKVGNVYNLTAAATVSPVLSTLRYFPDASARKYCYVIPAAKGGRYMVRTTYYYGGFDGGTEPPVFDQIIEGTTWSAVNTSESYAGGLAAYYEVVVAATGKSISVCLARNERTTSSPFISALELQQLDNSMYNSTDFTAYALSTVARHSFGYNGSVISYPADQYNRNWEPFVDDEQPVVESRSNVTSSDFWNLPPEVVFHRGITTSRGKSLTIRWPPTMLPDASYYLALYFQDNRSPSSLSWRVFDVSVNGSPFYRGLNISTAGSMVYGPNWPLSGSTQITLTPDENSPVGPVINAGELFMIVTLGGRTHPRDVIAMEALARSFNNPPPDWSGDPCLPRQNSWTGVTCSEGKFARVISLNLTNYGLGGSLPYNIAMLTAISSIWLGGNNLTGTIPDMISLKLLKSLHLENNQLTGPIPPSLGELKRLQELFLQNNNLQGQLPDTLKSRRDINIRIFPGNQIH